MHFMHFHDSCTRNCDHHIFLIIAVNAHKERILPQTISNRPIFKQCERGEIETQSKVMVAANDDRFHNYRNQLFNGRSIIQFVAARFLLTFAVLSSLAALFALFPA